MEKSLSQGRERWLHLGWWERQPNHEGSQGVPDSKGTKRSSRWPRAEVHPGSYRTEHGDFLASSGVQLYSWVAHFPLPGVTQAHSH